ncbi:MAG: alpha-amylase family glycosyl hydrolase [Chthoniobacter sp.]
MRAYYQDNVRYWMEEFHIDGFRLDATHTIFDDSPRHILAELAEVAHSRGPLHHRGGRTQPGEDHRRAGE